MNSRPKITTLIAKEKRVDRHHKEAKKKKLGRWASHIGRYQLEAKATRVSTKIAKALIPRGIGKLVFLINSLLEVLLI